MQAVFLKIVNMSITASYIILAILIARLLLKKVPKKYSYLLWCAAGFRLCCPISFQSVFSLFSVKPFDMTKAQSGGGQSLNYITPPAAEGANAQFTTGIPSLNTVAQDNISAAAVHYTSKADIALTVISYIWAAVLALLVIYAAVSYIKLIRQLQNSVLLEEGVYQSDKIQAPFILAEVKPKIYIPFGLDAEVRDYVLLHERYHIKRLDYIVKPFAFILLAIHWFNPLCWLAFILMSKDMEMSCDEKVLSRQTGIKKEYSSALLSFATVRHFPAPSPLSFSEGGAKARIKNVLSYRKPKIYLSVIAIILCTALLAACTANPKVNNSIKGDTEYVLANSYTAGRCIADVAYLSSIMPDGSYYGKITVTKESLKIESLENDISFSSETVDTQEYTRKELIHYLNNDLMIFVTNLKQYISTEYNSITEIKYTGNSEDNFYFIYWYNNIPLMFSDGRRIFELLPSTESLDNAVSNAIIETNKNSYLKGDLACESHYIYSTRAGSIKDKNDRSCVTVYAQVLYTEFEIKDEILRDTSSGMSPAAIVFTFDNNCEYTLKEYYDFNSVGNEIDSIFPEDISEMRKEFEADNHLAQACFSKAIDGTDFDVDKAIEKLFDTIESNPDAAYSSAPGDYITASENEYILLQEYGDYTLKYIFKEFLKGGQTDLKGQLMRTFLNDDDVMEPNEKYTIYAETGQDYFDSWYYHAKRLYKLYDAAYMKEFHPKAWMLLEMDYIDD